MRKAFSLVGKAVSVNRNGWGIMFRHKANRTKLKEYSLVGLYDTRFCFWRVGPRIEEAQRVGRECLFPLGGAHPSGDGWEYQDPV